MGQKNESRASGKAAAGEGGGEGPSESMARLFALGLKKVAIRRARAGWVGLRMITMFALLAAATLASMTMSMMLFSFLLLLGASPLIALLLDLNYAPGAEPRIFALAWSGAASWIFIPLWLKGCDALARWKAGSALSAEQLKLINAAGGQWFKKSVRRWFEGKAAFCKGAEEALDAAVISKGDFLPTARALGWLAATPLATGALALCVGPWAMASVGQWGFGLARGALKSAISGARLARSRIISPSLAASGAREWARKKALQVAREGAGTEDAARAQKAALEKALPPLGERSRASKRL